MWHRGPDGQGVFANDRLAIGHLRLSVIDIDNGAQPMWNPEQTVMLSYNGEVYNYPELMSECSRDGWIFRSKSDTEVLLAQYVRRGEEFDFSLNGMYAYAMLDTRVGGGSLQIGVDPIGIKPLYLAQTAEAIVFASELRGIIAGLKHLCIPVELKQEAVAQFLMLGWVPPPRSMVENVRKLRPGERLKIDITTAGLTSLADRAMPEAEPGDIAAVLEDSVKRQVVSDAPLGFFLSGGIDSSLLVATASRMGVRPKTFTARFSGVGHGVQAADESAMARVVAQHCGADHHELEVTSESLIRGLDDALVAMDQPIADPACLPLLYLARFAREHVKVCLSGDGGDELFLGYPRHQLARKKAIWRTTPDPFRKLIGGIASTFPAAPSSGWRETLRKARVGFELLESPYYISGPFTGRAAWFLSIIPDLPHWAKDVPAEPEALFEADMLGQLAGQMLPKTDHVAMYAGLECRVPFLDLQMIAASRAVPADRKVIGGRGKAPLRELLKASLPEEVAQRKKQGFRVPLTSWFRNEIASDIRARLLDPAVPCAGIIGRAAIERVLSEHISGLAEHSNRIWSLLALQAWLDRLAAAEPA